MADTPALPTELAAAHQRFDELVRSYRADLHRYCSRLVGSAIDGEDVVQDVLAKAYYQLSMCSELPALRPWLFRVAYTTALDFMRRYDRRFVEPLADVPEPQQVDDAPSPEVVRAALSTFVMLRPAERSAVILKDILGYSLEEIAEASQTTVQAVKATLFRGRARLKQQQGGSEPTAWADRPETAPEDRERLHQYVQLFNTRDWTALRALLNDETRLEMVSRASRRGKAAGVYYGNYSEMPDVWLRVGKVEGRQAIGSYSRASGRLTNVILIDWRGDRISMIRDYLYVPYLAQELVFVPDDASDLPPSSGN
jgi:RNA polymerase sigma factor (sigma-70 family)